MDKSESGKNRLRQITRTGVLVALLVTLQWATAGSQIFAGQYITGTLVNCVLSISALMGGLWCGVAVGLVSPFAAFLLGIGPKLVQIVPCIAIANCVYVVILNLLLYGKKSAFYMQLLWVLTASLAKFVFLYTLVLKVVIPIMQDSLKQQQIKTFSVMFSWPQLITAFLGGFLAILLYPLLRKAVK